MGLCLFANNHVIDHEETRMIYQNKKPTAVSLAGVMRKGENGVGLLRFYKNVKYCILEAMHMRRLRAFACPEIRNNGLPILGKEERLSKRKVLTGTV